MSDSEEDRHIDKKRRLLPTLDKQTKADKQITIDEQTATDAPIVHTGQNSTLPTEWPEQSSSDSEDRHIDKKRRLLPTLDKQTKADKQITTDEQTATDAPIVHTGQNSTLPTEWPEQSSGSASLLGELSSVLFGSVSVPNAPRKHKGASKKKLEPFSKEDIITKEVMELLGEDAVQHGQEGYAGWNAPYKQHDVVELTIARLSSHGDAIAIAPSEQPWAVLVPFALPGEVVKARIFKNMFMHSFADLLEVIKPNPKYRDDSRVKCKYFGECSGCQYQLKRDVIMRAPPLNISASNLHTYRRGASLLLRESTDVKLSGEVPEVLEAPRLTIANDQTEWIDDSENEQKTAITDHKKTVHERVGNTKFEYTAGSFFQNNNVVLVPLTSYVRDAVFVEGMPEDERPTHLVDAYCGSGLFALTLAPAFQKVKGIELSADSIAFAKRNARINKLDTVCEFIAGQAHKIFDEVQDFPRDRTALVIDPPRKGCDEDFINQLLRFKPRTVVYVSCNVTTQARDLGDILRKSEEELEGQKYIIESLKGFDLFPQTYHVESVAVLRLVDA
ncbi:hypothetical protein EIP86_004440 [Pleurotus ostreatoroseus]|nr:hypothetical protein EIP86_004440 [Pleurotus ostreatoroseus]